ncbi:cation diffusion facilitator family transporter [Croceibacterium aestuarii]|uniref:cation diffusion facilitator family transporter n=1 Tax=Croceibacterium aestuarii TaxID=3064139 RepID=UPI00272E0916|nr:cation diffusion facilitator family transporter [Croceibacterium sp. D39]
MTAISDDPAARARLTRSAAFASITMASVLAAMKIWAVWKTDSTAMLGSLADTGLDLVASIATLIGVWIAAQPADEDHRFGHGKAEALAALFQVVLITLSAVGIAYRAVGELISGGRVASANEGIAVSALAILGTFALLAWQRHVIRSTGSIAIKTDNVHYKSDLYLNLAVIAALVLDRFVGIAGADPAFGLMIALWLAWGAWRASSEALDHLMDREWPDDKRDEFIAVLARIPEVHGMHDLRTRTSGVHDFAQFHISVDPQMTVAQAHVVMDKIEDRLDREFPGVEVLIHTDPIGLVDETGAAAEELLPQDGSAVT